MFGFHLRSYLSAPIIATFVMSSQDSPSSLFSGTVNHHLAACAAHRYSRIAMAIEAFSKHPSRNTSVTRRRWRIGLALEVVSPCVFLFCAILTSLRFPCAIFWALLLYMAALVAHSSLIATSTGWTRTIPTPTLFIGLNFLLRLTYLSSLG